jgi:modification methylase
LARVLLSSSKPGDLVIDPFNSTGTTGAVANASRPPLPIGFERDQTYAKLRPKRASRQWTRCRKPRWRRFMTARDAPRVVL